VKGFAKRRPVLTYWLISVLLAGILIPIGLMVLDLYPTAFDEILESAGGKLTTNILYEFPRVLGVKGGVAIFLFTFRNPRRP
jgi:hypothetical protein